jgi:predicted neutral ceramidase superfamily lipid hydrolase
LDLSRIASIGAIFYIVMDIAIHWGVLRKLRHEVKASPAILVTAIVLDVIVLTAFIGVKVQQDIFVVYASVIGFAAIVIAEMFFLRRQDSPQ